MSLHTKQEKGNNLFSEFAVDIKGSKALKSQGETDVRRSFRARMVQDGTGHRENAAT